MNSNNKKPAKKTSKAKKSPTPGMGLDEIMPLMATAATDTNTRSRRNAASSIERTDRYKNIDDGLIPFKYSSGSYQNKSSIDVKDAVILCQKAYYNFAVFRNTIDLMTEFSVNNIYFKGGSKKARKFFNALFKKINLWSLQDKFFREYYRSGNVFIYRFDVKLKDQDLKKITQTFGSNEARASAIVPSKYIILNPADVRLMGTLSFADSNNYYKVLSPYELQRLRKPQTEEDEEFLNSLPKEVVKSLKKGTGSGVMIPLEQEKIVAVFYKRQDYEPFAVPMGYPVLEDINAKAEMKKIDMAISRTMQQVVLLVTMGAEPEKGGINQKNLTAMQKLFTNESVGRVLIADYTTKAEFVVPSIGALLDPSKYVVLDRDIRTGLNNILIGEDEKFSNQSIKVKVFIERLKQARETFINEFLFPEIKRICRALGFKNYPTPHFDDIDLRDGLQYSRVYTRLVELGVLTPEQGITAVEKGRLPSEEDIEEGQEEYRKLRDKGFFEPIMGGPHTQKKAQDATRRDRQEEQKHQVEQKQQELEVVKEAPKENGRPEGAQAPQTTKEVSPVGEGDQSKAKEQHFFSLEKIKNNLILAQKLHADVEKALRAKYDIKRMTNKQKAVAESVTELIIANEAPDNWGKNIEKYVNTPVDHNPERAREIMSLCGEHDVDAYLGSILFVSKK